MQRGGAQRRVDAELNVRLGTAAERSESIADDAVAGVHSDTLVELKTRLAAAALFLVHDSAATSISFGGTICATRRKFLA